MFIPNGHVRLFFSYRDINSKGFRLYTLFDFSTSSASMLNFLQSSLVREWRKSIPCRFLEVIVIMKAVQTLLEMFLSVLNRLPQRWLSNFDKHWFHLHCIFILFTSPMITNWWLGSGWRSDPILLWYFYRCWCFLS